MNTEIKKYIIMQLQELQADFEDLSNKELIECRECMLERVNSSLIAIGGTDEYNI